MNTPSSKAPSLRSWQFVWYSIVAVVCQVLFWNYSMPGPQIAGQTTLADSIFSCCVSVLTLLLLPCAGLLSAGPSASGLGSGLGSRLRGMSERLGLTLGDFAFGYKAVLLATPVMLLGTWIGRTDTEIKAFYPIPGDDVFNTVGTGSAWLASYLAFYVSFEFFYRGFLLRGFCTLGEDAAAWKCIAFQAVCCCAIHIGKPTAEWIASFPASLLFGWIAYRSGSIWYAVVIHFLIGIVNDVGAIG